MFFGGNVSPCSVPEKSDAFLHWYLNISAAIKVGIKGWAESSSVLMFSFHLYPSYLDIFRQKKSLIHHLTSSFLHRYGWNSPNKRGFAGRILIAFETEITPNCGCHAYLHPQSPLFITVVHPLCGWNNICALPLGRRKKFGSAFHLLENPLSFTQYLMHCQMSHITHFKASNFKQDWCTNKYKSVYLHGTKLTYTAKVHTSNESTVPSKVL